MAKPISDGRMIRKDISDSDGFNALSDRAAVLFCMMIPHFNPFGKMPGGPGYIKEIICPKRPGMAYENIPEILAEISGKTNVKWFQHDGRWWLHSLHFLSEHQKLPVKRLGQDLLPDYPGASGLVRDKSRTSPGVVRDQSATSPAPNENEKENEKEKEPVRACEEKKSEPAPFLPGPLSEEKPDVPVNLTCLAGHSFEAFKALMPLRDGIFMAEEECCAYWARQPALWNEWISAVRVYRDSREVAAGVVCSPLKFLRKKWRDYVQKNGWPLGQQNTTHGPPGNDFDAQDEDRKRAEEFDAKVAAGEIALRPRERLSFESQEEYVLKLAEGKVPMVRAP